MIKTSPSNTYPGFFTKTSLIQLGYGIWANLTTMTIGLAYGFPSVQIPQLNDPGSKFKVTIEEASWIASILSLFCPIGCVLSGVLMDKYGRSIMIMVCHLPMCLGWIYTVTATSALHMIIARAVLGLGCGMAMGPPRLYTSEISLPNMRGLLGGTPNVFLSLGITLQAALGLLFPWTNLCYISGAFNVMLFFSYCFLTETPYYMLLRETPEHATKALAAFRAKDYNLGMEINQLMEFKQNNNIRSLNFSEKLNEMFSRCACQPFGIIITFITFGCLTGCPIVTFWTIELLKATNSSFDVYEGNFYIAFTRFIFGIVAFVLLFKTPRKTMALISVSGVSLTWLAFGAYLHQDPGPSFAPQMFLMIFTAFACLSFYVLPFLLMSELYPLQIRGTLTGISIAITNIELFLTAKCFPVLKDAFGVPNVILMFSASAFFCYIFLFLLLPETKGLTLQEIEEYFKGHRASPATVRQLSSMHQFGEKSRKDSNLNDMVENAGRHKLRRDRMGRTGSTGVTSITSRESKKSVSLLMGKQFRDMTKQDEMDSTVDNTAVRKTSSSGNETSTSDDAERSKKEKDAKK